MDEIPKDRRAGWGQYQIFVLDKLDTLGKQCDRIESSITFYTSQMEDKFQFMNEKIEENKRNMENLRAKITTAAAIASFVVSVAVSVWATVLN